MRPELSILDALALAVILFGGWCGVVALAAGAARILEKIGGSRGPRPSIFDDPRPMARKVRR